jgi:tRNA nucleotidyltransferase/poly(A) polymerase
MSNQFDIANQLILRKNTELLQIAKNTRLNEEVIHIIDSLLDKKELDSTELLAHPVVNKVRIFLRERVLFERELFEKLTFHNKKIQILEEELKNKEMRLDGHSSILEQQCKELNRNVTSLQKQLMGNERELTEKKNEVEMLRNEYTIEKKNFVLKMRELSQ